MRMQLSVRDVAELCEVSESTVYRWVQDDGLPAEQVNGLYRVHPAELLEWATARNLAVSPMIFQKLNGNSIGRSDLSEALDLGGVVKHVAGDDREAVLAELVEAIPLSRGFAPEMLVQLLVARERVSSTAIGDGIAIPHARNPLILPGARRVLRVGYLSRPIDFNAPDGKLVDTLFLMICPTVHDHLQLLARLATLLRHDGFRRLLAERPDKHALIEAVRASEQALIPEAVSQAGSRN